MEYLQNILTMAQTEIILVLTDIINHIIITSDFPDKWSKGIIHPIHKKVDLSGDPC